MICEEPETNVGFPVTFVYETCIEAVSDIFNLELKTQMDTKWQEILATKGYDEEGLGTGAYVAIAIFVVVILTSATMTIIKKTKKTI